MSSREAVAAALEAFSEEVPGEDERMAASIIKFIEETKSRLRRQHAAATVRTAGCRICVSPRRGLVDRMLIVGKWSPRGIAKRTTFTRQDIERHRQECLSSAAKAGWNEGGAAERKWSGRSNQLTPAEGVADHPTAR